MLAGCSSMGPVPVAEPANGASQPSKSLPSGLVQRSGVRLSDADLNKALQAEQYALSTAPAGEVIKWQGRQASGSVTAASPYQVGDQNCRQYTQRVIVDGVEKVARGAACRETGGNWALLT